MITATAVFDIIATVIFFMTFVYSMKNYKMTKHINDFWIVFSIASFIAFAWTLIVSLEWIGVYPLVMDEIEQAIVASMATAFAIAATSFIRPIF